MGGATPRHIAHSGTGKRDGWQGWAGVGRRWLSLPSEAHPHLATYSVCTNYLIGAGSPLTLPGWSCGAGEQSHTCLALLDLAEKTNSVFPASPVTASKCCSHQYEEK